VDVEPVPSPDVVVPASSLDEFELEVEPGSEAPGAEEQAARASAEKKPRSEASKDARFIPGHRAPSAPALRAVVGTRTARISRRKRWSTNDPA
jgi:hypothetical protein